MASAALHSAASSSDKLEAATGANSGSLGIMSAKFLIRLMQANAKMFDKLNTRRAVSRSPLCFWNLPTSATNRHPFTLMNLPNKLTVALCADGFLGGVVLAVGHPFRNTFALFFFCLPAWRILNSRIARARKLIAETRILMDPLADKIMTCSAFIAFRGKHTFASAAQPVKVGAWMVIIIVSRELAITGLRLLAAFESARGGALREAQDHFADRHHHCAAGGGRVPGMAGRIEEPVCGVDAGLCGCHAVAHRADRAVGIIYLWRNRALYLEDV